MGTEELLIKINGNAKSFNNEVDKIKKRTKDLEKNLSKAAKTSAIAFAALAGAVFGATLAFAKFEKGFTNVVTLLDKTSFKTKTFKAGVDSLKKGILDLGAATGESFESLNQGLFDLISAGVDAEESINVLASATELATAGATETSVAVKALTAAITSFGEEAGTSQDVAEKFFTAQKFGVTTVAELGAEFNKVAGLAKELGLSFDETLAASTSLTANGAKPTARAFTEMKAVLNAVVIAQGNLKTESAAVRGALSLQNIEQVGLVEALNQTKAAVGGDVVQLQKLLGSAEAVSAALSLTGAQAGTFTKILKELGDEENRAGTFADALAVKQDSITKSFARTSQSVQRIAILIGEKLAPSAKALADTISEMADRFSNLDDSTLDNIATLLKWATIIAGAVAAVTGFTLVILKVIVAVKALVVFGGIVAGVIAAIAALAAPILAVAGALAGLAGIVTGTIALFKKFGKKQDTTAIDNVIDKLDELKKKRDEVAREGGFLKSRDVELAKIDQEIAKQEELRKKLEDVNKEKEKESTSEKEKKDKEKKDKEDKEKSKVLAAEQRRQELLAIEQDTADKIKEIRTAENAASKLEQDNASKDRVEGKREEATILKQIAALEKEQSVLSAEEKKTAIQEVEARANEEKLAILKTDLANNRAAQEEARQNEIIDQQEHEIAKQEARLENFEQSRALEEELNNLKAEDRENLNAKDLAELKGQLLTEQKAEEQIAKQSADTEIKARNKEIIDTKKHGVVVGKLNRALGSEEVQGVKDTAAQLAQLQRSKNSTLKAIGKAAALVQIGISTSEGAIKAYTSLAGIPFIGPGLGAAAAAALTAFGLERAREVAGIQRGGVVPPAIGGTRDRVPALLEPSELVVPRPLVPDFIQAVGRPDVGAIADDETSGVVVSIGIEDDAEGFITAQQREAQALATGGL